MIRQTKKLFLGLFSLGAIFVIAGCGQNQASDQNANNAQQAQTTRTKKIQIILLVNGNPYLSSNRFKQLFPHLI